LTKILNLKFFPTELVGKLVTENWLKLGLSLTFTSLMELTSVEIAPPLPSSLKIAYERIEQPPLSTGGIQLIVIYVDVCETTFEAANPDGVTQE